jgi:hypothetical protein
MIAEAPLDPPWHRVNWRRAKAAVRRLQTRIVKATKRRRRVLYGALSKPEPCAGKLACTVLRGLSDGDITQLPDRCKVKQ